MEISFGEFELDPRRFELRRRGKVVPVERRIFDLIHFLIVNRDRLVSADEVFAQLWSGRKVTKSSLTVAIAAARRALSDTPRRQSAIKTIPGRGYRFVATLREQSRTQADARSPDAGPLVTGPQPFVGRGSELTTLQGAFQRVLAGHIQCAFVSGEPGIGKSRLATEFSALASACAADTLTGRCCEGDGAPPLWPWVEIVRGAITDRRILPLSAHLETELSELLPELRCELPTHTRPISREANHARFLLFDAVSQLIERKSRLSPLLIVLEDLHRADLPSLELLRFLLRQNASARLLVIATYREGELRNRISHSHLLGQLRRDLDTHDLPLSGLDRSEISRLVERSIGQSPTDQTVLLLQEKTAGNPFFLTQLLPLLSRSPGFTDQLELPLGIRESILRQLDALPSTTRWLLSLASVVGRDFTTTILEELTENSHAAILDLHPAIDAGLVAPTSAVGHTFSYRFAHVLVRDALYSELSPWNCAHIHARVAESLKRIHPNDPDEHVAMIAHHFQSASTVSHAEQAIEYSQKAARAAAQRFAYEEATHHFERALALVQRASGDSDLAQCETLVELGAAQCRAGNRAAAKTTFERASRLARDIGAAEVLAKAALGLAPGFLAVEGGVLDVFLIELLEQGIAALGDRNPSLRARLLARLAMALIWAESTERRTELLREAIELAQVWGDADTRLYVSHARWITEWKCYDVDQRFAEAQALVSEAENVGNPEMLLVCRLFRLLTLLETGQSRAFEDESELFAVLADELRQPQSMWYAKLFKGTRALLSGRFDDAERLAHEFSALGSQISDANSFHSLMTHLLVLRWERGRLDEFVHLAEDGVRRFPAMTAWRAGLAWTLVNVGRVDEARVQFEHLAREGFSSLPQRFDWQVTAALTADVCSQLGDRARAEELYRLLLPLAARHMIIGLCVVSWGPVSRQLGLLAATLSRWEDATEHFQHAIRESERTGARPWQLHATADYAQMLLTARPRRSRQEARRLLRTTVFAARELGMVRLVARAEKLLQSH